MNLAQLVICDRDRWRIFCDRFLAQAQHRCKNIDKRLMTQTTKKTMELAQQRAIRHDRVRPHPTLSSHSSRLLVRVRPAPFVRSRLITFLPYTAPPRCRPRFTPRNDCQRSRQRGRASEQGDSRRRTRQQLPQMQLHAFGKTVNVIAALQEAHQSAVRVRVGDLLHQSCERLEVFGLKAE